MAQYDVYETGFDNLNETLVFGSRAIDGKSLYEISTLAVIRSSDTENRSGEYSIKITTHYNKVNGSVYLAIDNCLRILKSIEEPDLIATHEFDDNLECISVSTCGRFLLLCTQHGHIYVTDLNLIQNQTTGDMEAVCSELSFIFTGKVDYSAQENVDNFFLTTFADKTEVLTFYVVTCTGLVMKITSSLDEHEEEQFFCELAYDANQTIHVATCAYPYLCMEGTELGILDIRNMEYQSDDALKIKTVYAAGYNFIAYGYDGKIYLIDSTSCLVFGVNDAFPDRLDEFEYLWFIGNEDSSLILAITKHRNIQACRSITDADVLYDIHLEHPINLNSYMKGYSEEIVFVSEVYKNETLAELRLQIITTTDPKLRVQKLINQGQIDKAEMFAKQFNLDQDCIGEAKSFNIIKKNECTSEDIDELFRILDTINNEATKLQFCDSVVCKTAIDTRRVLSYAASTEATSSKMCANLDLRKINYSVKLRRFDTYMSVYKEYDQRQWSIFVECDLIGELNKFLRRGCTDEAIRLVLSALCSEEFASTLTDDEVDEVISAVTEPCIEQTLSFLNAFIPLVLKYKSGAMEILIKWVCNRIIEMETDVDFPECAITFLNDINNIISHAHPRSHFDNAREKLQDSLKALKNIQRLKYEFNVHLSLKDCLQGSYAIVPTLLNVCVERYFKLEKLRLLVKEILCPILLECQGQSDEILGNQIKSFFQFEEIYWLDTALVLLELISGVDYKLSLIQEILIKTSKPWSDKVKEIGFLVFNYPTVHPLQQKIKKLLKNEQFLILLEKYDINENNFVTWDDKKFYFRRIIYLNGDDYNKAFNDIRLLCDQKEQFEADYLMMTEFVSKDGYKVAFTLMDKMEPHYVCSLGKRLLFDICSKTRRFINDTDLRETFYNALEPLWNRLKRYCNKRQLDKMLNSYNATRATYWMYTNFKIKLELALAPALVKANITTFLVELNKAKQDIEVNTLIDYCEKISSFFEETLDTVLLEYISICQHSFRTLVKIGEYLLESSQCPHLLTQCAVNIIKCLQQESSSGDNKTFLETTIAEDEINANSSNDLEAARLAFQLCVRAALYNEDEDKITLSAIVEVLRLINCINCNLNSFIGELDLQASEKSLNLLPLTATMAMLCNTHETSKNIVPPHCSFLMSDQLMNVDMKEEVSTFIWNSRILLNQKQHFNVFNMIRLIQQSSIMLSETQREMLAPLNNYLHQSVLCQTIEMLLNENYWHKDIIFQLMLLYDSDLFHKIIMQYFRFYRKSPTKIQTIAQISLEVLNSKDNIQLDKTVLVNLINACKWWFRFNSLNLSFEAFITANPKERLKALIQEDKVTVVHLPEYCADFCIELESCYLTYLKIVLLNWRPNIAYTTEINGKRSIQIQNSEDEILEKCDKVLVCISNTKGVLNLTKNLWNSVNFYYYEVYLALLQLHQKVAPSSGAISELYQPLICFLKNYTRVNKPTSTEVEMWCGANPLKPLIDTLSEFRLPLTSTFLSNEIWSIIKSEVNLDTYKQWFKLADYLSQYLQKQDICVYAITSPISSGLVDTTRSTWTFSSKLSCLLPKIEECANSMENLERATASVYNLMCQMPNGTDKVELAKLSYKFAKLYFESAPNQSVKQTYVKVKQRFFNYSASHILYKYQLAGDIYLGLVAKPSELIAELYNDPSIKSYYNNSMYQCPGINSAVEELCALFQLDVLDECARVLLEFLNCDFELTLSCRRLQKENIIRATYLCKGKHLEHWQNYLIHKGLDESEDNEKIRANALTCFYYLSSFKTIEEMCHMTHDEFLNYLAKVSILDKLSNIGVPCNSVSQLDEENKKRLLKNLSKLNSPSAVQCVAIICKTYGFNNMKYWHYIVNLARQFQMYDDLRDYLEFLSGKPVSENIKKAWYVVLDHAFNNFEWDTISQAEIYLLIQNCPIFELDFEPYIQKCIHHQRQDLANILKKSK